jgi:hypothetical protein
MEGEQTPMSPEGAISKYHTTYGGKVDGILVFELATGTGFQHGEPNKIDAFWMAVEPSKGLRRIAYEVKVSRSDFLREIREPRKRRAALRVSNQFFFVTPPGIAKAEEIPLECGLKEVQEDGRLVTVVDAPFRDGLPASWHFFASFARRLRRAYPETI